MSGNKKNIKKLAAFLSLLFLGITMSISCSSATTPSSIARQKAIEKSPQWKDGQFRNTLKRSESSIWSMIKAEISNDAEYMVPKEPIPTVTRKGEEFATPPANDLRVTWFGHSSVLIEIDGHRVLTDPVWSDRTSPFSFIGPKRFFAPPLPLDELPNPDVVIISHDHYDHLDKETIETLKDRVSLFAVPLGVGAHLEEWGVDPANIVERDWWETVEVGTLTLTATPARHFSGRSITDIHGNPTLWSGWSIAGPEHRVYYSGDTAMFPGFTEIGERLGPFDLTLIEIGSYNKMWSDVHVGPEQAVQAHRMVRGKLLFPVHWATFNLALHNWTEPAERLIVASNQFDVPIVIPKPGESVLPDAPSTVTRWWPNLKWQSAEEAPIISTGLEKKPDKQRIQTISLKKNDLQAP